MARQRNSSVEVGSVSGESEYVPRSDEELKELALGVIAGTVFGTWNIPKHSENLISSIFPIIIFLDDIERKKMRRDGIIHFYEWKSKAGPLAINGYPTFLSAHSLNAGDTDRLNKKIAQIRKALEEL